MSLGFGGFELQQHLLTQNTYLALMDLDYKAGVDLSPSMAVQLCSDDPVYRAANATVGTLFEAWTDDVDNHTEPPSLTGAFPEVTLSQPGDQVSFVPYVFEADLHWHWQQYVADAHFNDRFHIAWDFVHPEDVS